MNTKPSTYRVQYEISLETIRENKVLESRSSPTSQVLSSSGSLASPSSETSVSPTSLAGSPTPSEELEISLQAQKKFDGSGLKYFDTKLTSQEEKGASQGSVSAPK